MTKNTLKYILDTFINIHTDSKEYLFDEVFPLYLFEEVLKELGYNKEEDEDPTNGWQVDFWYYFGNKSFIFIELSGSLWNGNYKIRKCNRDGSDFN